MISDLIVGSILTIGGIGLAGIALAGALGVSLEVYEEYKRVFRKNA